MKKLLFLFISILLPMLASAETKDGNLVSNNVNQMEALYGEWWLVGWNDGGNWFEVDTNYVSHQHLSIKIPKEGYVTAYSMVNEIFVGLLTLNGNEMAFSGEMRGSTQIYGDMKENLFFEDHIFNIKSYQLEGNLLKLYYTESDYFVFTSDFDSSEEHFYEWKDGLADPYIGEVTAMSEVEVEVKTINSPTYASLYSRTVPPTSDEICRFAKSDLADQSFEVGDKIAFRIVQFKRLKVETGREYQLKVESCKGSGKVADKTGTMHNDRRMGWIIIGDETNKGKSGTYYYPLKNLAESYLTEGQRVRFSGEVYSTLKMPWDSTGPCDCYYLSTDALAIYGGEDDYIPFVESGVKINEATFPDSDFRNWVLSQEYGKDGILTEDEIAGVTFVNLFPQNIKAEGHIKSLKGIEHFTAMTKLVCSRNELTELDLSKNTAMTWLECYGNHLTRLDLSKNTELTYLDCQSNELTALNLSGCIKLTELNCSNNQLTTLNVSGCSGLKMLKGSYNLLTELYVSGCTSLTTIWVFNNQLPVLDVSDSNLLSMLNCEDNQLTQLDVSKNTILTELRCSNNQLTSLDLSKNKMLETLRTYHNPLNGEAMNALIESLPIVSSGGWCCILSEDEEDVVTIAQVVAAKAKGWTSYYWDDLTKNWIEYAGSEAAQDAYRPFVEEGKVWKVGNSQAILDHSVQVVDYYYFDGDTIIDGKTCKQMMCQRFVGPGFSDEYGYWTPQPSLSRVGAWYEENQKVYFYDEMTRSMKLKYDFSLGDYETVDFLNVDGYPPYIIGSKQTGGIKGFKGVYRDIMMGENINTKTPWLEGVGGLDGPFASVYHPLADSRPDFLMSCAVGDEVIYLYDEYEDGATPAGARKNRLDFTHIIKTKPKARDLQIPLSTIPSSGEDDAEASGMVSLYGEYNDLQLGINLNSLAGAYQVSITNESGKAVYEKTINAGTIVALNIDISAYTKGRYAVTIENSDETFVGQFETQTTGIQVPVNVPVPHIYNLQGQRLSSLQKGLNIVNRQKIYVK